MEKNDDQFVSITRKEFETAAEKNIPIFIFVDKNVNADYETYLENQEFFDSEFVEMTNLNIETKKFRFAHADHINIFKFIDLIKIKPIKTFDRVEEIEQYLKMQFAGLFYLYLESLKQKSEDDQMLSAVTELQRIIFQMNQLLKSVGRQVLGPNEEEFKKVIQKQLDIVFDFYFEKFFRQLSFINSFNDEELNNFDLNKIAEIFYQALNKDIEVKKWTTWEEYRKLTKEIDAESISEIQDNLNRSNPKIIIDKFNFRSLNEEFHERVLPIINSKDEEEIFLLRLVQNIKQLLSELPF